MHQEAGSPPAAPAPSGPDAISAAVGETVGATPSPSGSGHAGQAPRVEVAPPSGAGEQVRIHVDPGMEIVLSDEAFEPARASYAVDGADLVVVLPNGSVVTLVDFFAVANPPAIIALLDSPAVAAPTLLGQAVTALDPATIEPAAGPPSQPEKSSGNASFTPIEVEELADRPPSLKDDAAPRRVLGELVDASDFTPGVLPESDTLAIVTVAPEETILTPSVDGRPLAEPLQDTSAGPAAGPAAGQAGEGAAVAVEIVHRLAGATPPTAPGLPPPQPGVMLPAGAVASVDPRFLLVDPAREVVVGVEQPGGDGPRPQAIGIVEIGPDDGLGAVRVFLADEGGPAGEIALGTLPAGTRLGLFTLTGLDGAGVAVLRDGPSLALVDAAGQPASLHDGAPPLLVRTGEDGQISPLGGVLLLSVGGVPGSPDVNPLNPDGLVHAVGGLDAATGERVIAFEQSTGLAGAATGDFADVLLRVRMAPAFQGEALHFPGGDGHLPVDLAPELGERLCGASVEIASGMRPGDRLVLDGVADRDGDGLVDGTPIRLLVEEDGRIGLDGEASRATYERVIGSIRFSSAATDIEPGTREITVRLMDAGGVALEPLAVRFELRETTRIVEQDRHDLAAGAGNDVIRALDGNDTIRGGAGHDHLDGGGGDDVLEGGPGDDVLIGLTGRDLLSGGAGADRFVITSLGDGHDTITDLDWSEGDRLDLTGLLAGSGFDPEAPDAARRLRLEPAGPDGEGRSQVRVIVDLDGAGTAFAGHVVATLLDPARLDGLEIATAATFHRGSDGGTG